MSFVSVADACRQLGIDAKTLHRWLAEAQLPLQSHPNDGRKKGVSHEHLHQLATVHHRSLPSSTPALSQPACPLPSELLGLPEQLAVLQTQIVALQEQVQTLSHLLQQHVASPALAAALTQQPSKSTPVSRPTAAAPRSPSAASAAAKTPARPTPRKPVHVIPRVEYVPEGHYVVISPKQGLLPFEPDSPAWFAWLAQQDAFRFVGKEGHFTAHHWWRVPTGAWRAHRHIRNQSYNQRLAPTTELSIAVLEQAAAALQAHLA